MPLATTENDLSKLLKVLSVLFFDPKRFFQPFMSNTDYNRLFKQTNQY